MKLRYPILILVLMVLAFSCIAGCPSTGGSYGSTPKPAIPDITPEVSPPPVSPAGIPSVVNLRPCGAHFNLPAWNADSNG